MAKTLNKMMIIGNVGSEFEIRYTPSGTAVGTLRVATEDDVYKDGSQVKETEWHNIVVFGKLAESLSGYIKKGDLVYVEGRKQTQRWEKQGIKQSKVEIIVDFNGSFRSLESKRIETTPQQNSPAPSIPQSTPSSEFDMEYTDDFPTSL